nr:MAG TPA: hypothetical protein [Caudoviricetes sp.]
MQKHRFCNSKYINYNKKDVLLVILIAIFYL